MATKAQVNTFITMIAPIAVRQAAKHGNKIYPSVCIAQACLESGYGTTARMIRANAVFGIKVGKSAYQFGTAWKGKAYQTGTTEYYDGKNPSKIVDWFRAYDSIEDSTEDYFDLLCTAKRYKEALNRENPLGCISGIQKAPYATDPNYVTKIMSIIAKNSLTRFDGAVGSITPAVSEQGDLYTKGRTYTLQKDMYVRKEAAGDHAKLEDLTADGKAHAFADEKGAVLKAGTRVTVREMKKLQGGAVWIRIPSGWICGKGKSGKVYVI